MIETNTEPQSEDFLAKFESNVPGVSDFKGRSVL